MKFVQARKFHKGRLEPIELVVLHDMEWPETVTTAEGCAAMFASPSFTRDASCHYCVDADSEVQCVLDEDTAWHAPGCNANGLGIEHAGYARQTAAEWADPYSTAMLERSAQLVADLCVRHSIPVRFVDAEGLKRREKGITTHAQVTLAFHKSGHTDPGAHFPMAEYLARVAELVRDSASCGDTEPPASPPLDLTTEAGQRWALEQLGYVMAAGHDGLVAGIKLFQRSHGLTADGIVGKYTTAALEMALEHARRDG